MGRARDSVQCSVRGTGWVGLHLELGSSSDMWVRARLSFSVSVKCG